MQFNEIINAKLSQETDRPLMKKDNYPVSQGLRGYLRNYGRDIKLPVVYKDLLNYRYATSLKDKNGKFTHWENAVYDLKEMEFLKAGLIETYAILKTEGDLSFIKHLDVSYHFSDKNNHFFPQFVIFFFVFIKPFFVIILFEFS